MKRSNLLVVIILALAAAGALGLFLSRPGAPATAANTQTATQTPAAANSNPLLAAAGVSNQNPAAETGSFFETTTSIVLHLLLAVILSAVLAFRPRKNFPLF